MTKKSRSGGSRAAARKPQLVGAVLARRLPAGLIDTIFILIIMEALAKAAGEVGPAAPLLRGAAVTMPLVYFLAFEAIYQTTPGKTFLGLSVVTVEGGKPDFMAHLLRAASRLPEALIIVPYVYSIVASPLNQRFGDAASDTLVVRRRRD